MYIFNDNVLLKLIDKVKSVTRCQTRIYVSHIWMLRYFLHHPTLKLGANAYGESGSGMILWSLEQPWKAPSSTELLIKFRAWQIL